MTLPPDEVARVFGQQLQQIRIQAGYTQGELAVACGLSRILIGSYEQSVRRPLPETVSILGRALEERLPGAATQIALAWLISAGGSAGAEMDLLWVLLHWPDLDATTKRQVVELAQADGAIRSADSPPRRRGRPRRPPQPPNPPKT